MKEDLEKDFEVIKYHLGEFGAEDRKKIEAWRDMSQTNRSTFLWYQKIILAIAHLKYYKQNNLKKAWSNFTKS